MTAKKEEKKKEKRKGLEERGGEGGRLELKKKTAGRIGRMRDG